MLLVRCRPYSFILYQSCKSCKLIQRLTVISFLFGFKLRSSKFIVCLSAMAVKGFSESLTYPATSESQKCKRQCFTQETILLIFSRTNAIICDVKRIGLQNFQELRVKGLDRVTFKFNGSQEPIKQLRKKHFKSSRFKKRQDFCRLKLHILGFLLLENTSNPTGVFFFIFNSVVISLKCL